MKRSEFFTIYTLELLVQIFICNSLNFTQLLTLTLLPMMVMCIPSEISTPGTLIIAFISGFLVDFFATGDLGLTIVALLPVALLKRTLMQLVIGDKTMSIKDEVSFRLLSFPKLATIVTVPTFLFLIILIWVDGAGTRSFGFNLARLVISGVTSCLFALITAGLLSSERKRR